MTCFLGLDIGTTSTIGILVRLPKQVVDVVSCPVEFHAPHAGWAEEDPAQWWSNVGRIVHAFIDKGIDPTEIGGVGVTGMLPAVVLLDDAGALIRRSIQQSDGRCGREVEAMRAEIDEDWFFRKAGNGINQQLVTAKLRWIEKHEPENFSRIATVFGSYDYINFRLTGRRVVEQNWALEAGFVDIGTHALSDALIALAHIDRASVPDLVRPDAVIGEVSAQAARETGLALGTPVTGGSADLIASALGAGLLQRGDVLLKFGGSVDVLVATDEVAPDPRMYLDYHLVPGLMVPNGCMSTGGSGLNWFVKTFASGLEPEAARRGVSVHRLLDEMAAKTPPGADGLLALPYFLGEKTPIHDPDARGMFHGISLSHTLGHFWRAMLEAYGYAIRHHIEVLRDMGHNPLNYLVSDGGASSVVWMQIVSDIVGEPLQSLHGHPGSCLGAAWAAAMGTGAANDWRGVSVFVTKGAVTKPDAGNSALYAEGYAAFRDLYGRNFGGGS